MYIRETQCILMDWDMGPSFIEKKKNMPVFDAMKYLGMPQSNW